MRKILVPSFSIMLNLYLINFTFRDKILFDPLIINQNSEVHNYVLKMIGHGIVSIYNNYKY